MSVRSEILRILAATVGPLTSAALYEKSREASGRPIVVQTLSVLKGEKLVDSAGVSEPADGERRMVLWDITKAGRDELERIDAEDGGKAGSKSAPRGKRRAKKAAGRAPKGSGKPRAKRAGRLQTAPKRPRWALADDGTFVLLGTRKPVEVEPGIARKLLDLVRAGADLAALAAFIEKLDEGAA